MSKRAMTVIILTLAVALAACVAAMAATGGYGSQSDPLITKSYLDEVVQPQLESEMKKQLDTAMEQMLNTAPGEFTELELKDGQSLSCAAGCEILLRSGGAKAAGEAYPALMDTTDGGGVNAGNSLTAYHMYMAAADGCGLTVSGSAKLLVSGTYLIQ